MHLADASLVITTVDPADEAAVRTFYDIYVACGRHDQASFVASPYTELASVMRQPTESFAYTGFLATLDGEPVGHGWYAEFLRHNPDQAFTTPRVLPEHRRRGIGGAILDAMTAHAVGRGRTTLLASPRWSVAAGPEGAGAPAVEFARKHGFRLALVEAKRSLALPVPADVLDTLGSRADPVYSIRVFAGRIPDDLVEAWAELEASLPTEAPTGDLITEDEPPSVASVRDDERVLTESGQVKYNAIAIAPDGTAVGYTDVVVQPGSGEPAIQWGTLVRRGHRGHGLGYGLKTGVLRLLQEDHPGVTSTVTSNALSNEAMVAVNDALGYEIAEYLGDVQRVL